MWPSGCLVATADRLQPPHLSKARRLWLSVSSCLILVVARVLCHAYPLLADLSTFGGTWTLLRCSTDPSTLGGTRVSVKIYDRSGSATKHCFGGYQAEKVPPRLLRQNGQSVGGIVEIVQALRRSGPIPPRGNGPCRHG
jgi:hypothetical protein